MKVTATDQEITSFNKSLEIEVEGKTYYATLYYDFHNGYEITFTDENDLPIKTPDWALDYEEKMTGDWRSLAYNLDELSGGWEFMGKREAEVA